MKGTPVKKLFLENPLNFNDGMSFSKYILFSLLTFHSLLLMRFWI